MLIPVYFIDSPTVTWTYNPSTGEASAAVALVGGGAVSSSAISSNGSVTPTAAETVELVTTASSTITRTLPAAASSVNVVVTVKKVDSGSGLVTVQGNGSPAESIDADTIYDLTNQYQFVRLLCDGTKWHVIGNN
jgi:hypothetical protein